MKAKISNSKPQVNRVRRKPDAASNGHTDGRPRLAAGLDGRQIAIGPDEHRVIGQVTDELGEHDAELYQRGGELVRVVRIMRPPTRRVRYSTGARIERIPVADLRSRITRYCRLVQVRKKKTVPAAPPAWLVFGVAAQASPWSAVRPLEGITESPLLRPDGSILQQPGYDPATGFLYEPAGQLSPIPERPTRQDALAACDALLNVVEDFPFAEPMHRAAWLASVLTPIARAAHEGPAPLFLTDANVRGCGKGLSTFCASLIATGREPAVAVCSADPEETRKVITSVAIAGEQIVLFDNLTGPFGNGPLDAALTASEWQDRRLGGNDHPRVPLNCTWYATGNNCLIAADTARRVCHIRLESPEERPEERSGFRHTDLLAWVRQDRPRLLRAALIVLAAFCHAGRPQADLKPWGSFEGWSSLVRQCVVWVGLPDPAGTRVALAEECDNDVATLRALVAVWRAIVPEGQRRTAADVLQTIDAQAVERQAQRDALVSTCPGKASGLPSPKQLGNLLRRFKGRVCDGLRFVAEMESHTKTLAWGLQ